MRKNELSKVLAALVILLSPSYAAADSFETAMEKTGREIAQLSDEAKTHFKKAYIYLIVADSESCSMYEPNTTVALYFSRDSFSYMGSYSLASGILLDAAKQTVANLEPQARAASEAALAKVQFSGEKGRPIPLQVITLAEGDELEIEKMAAQLTVALGQLEPGVEKKRWAHFPAVDRDGDEYQELQAANTLTLRLIDHDIIYSPSEAPMVPPAAQTAIDRLKSAGAIASPRESRLLRSEQPGELNAFQVFDSRTSAWIEANSVCVE